jgi:hypothetical protein
MLFPYSPSGYQDNWLHEALFEMFDTDLGRIDGGQPRLAWPESIPLAYQEVLRRRPSLCDNRIKFLDRFERLTKAKRALVRQAMLRHNQIPGIFDDGNVALRLSDLPKSIRKPIRDFYAAAFRILSDLGLRDENYKRLYDHLNDKVCAYCGIETLDAPGGPREALDHYLPSNHYPFAGVNFRNLTPMGNKCNSRYKLQRDVLRDTAGNRRSCFDPYAGPALSLNLEDSRPFEGEVVGLVTCPDWVIQWQGGDPNKIQTWEEVFNIPERYRNSHLNAEFRSWINHFCQWALRRGPAPSTPHLLSAQLNEYAATVVPEGNAGGAFLKRATFLMLANRCDNSPEGIRLFDWLHDNLMP